MRVFYLFFVVTIFFAYSCKDDIKPHYDKHYLCIDSFWNESYSSYDTFKTPIKKFSTVENNYILRTTDKIIYDIIGTDQDYVAEPLGIDKTVKYNAMDSTIALQFLEPDKTFAKDSYVFKLNGKMYGDTLFYVQSDSTISNNILGNRFISKDIFFKKRVCNCKLEN